MEREKRSETKCNGFVTKARCKMPQHTSKSAADSRCEHVSVGLARSFFWVWSSGLKLSFRFVLLSMAALWLPNYECLNISHSLSYFVIADLNISQVDWILWSASDFWHQNETTKHIIPLTTFELFISLLDFTENSSQEEKMFSLINETRLR